ncbi:Oxoglutarate/iron-dependent dioxygenase [Trema orientale]|uniref:Oxoglutarate/iron-dependent dioxygenase n=1 Tax=Trema orientale TaxID=63057 RepID=A0A2P5EV66_TREOI|nr:Oxoglutarate/iron-dependent dioxygenase [Trema orientale]
MGSQTEHKIPVINFSEENLKPGSDSWVLASKQIRYGLEEYGCFEIVYDNFPLQLHQSIFDAAKEVLDLPKETKMQKTSDRPGALSYVAPNPAVPLYENIAIYNPSTLEGAESFTNIMWPQGNRNFRDTVHSFSKRLEELYEITTRMVFENYDVEALFDSFRNSSLHMLRLFKYRARQMNDTNVGLIDHTDSTFITILHQIEVQGLQIKTKDGKWIDVQPSASSFIVIAGDALKAWSNDRVRACEHHVIINLENKERYSIGLFTFIKGVIHVPKELVTDEYPLRYKPFDNLAFSRFYLTEEARNSPCLIKTFCGI